MIEFKFDAGIFAEPEYFIDKAIKAFNENNPYLAFKILLDYKSAVSEIKLVDQVQRAANNWSLYPSEET